jgi:hypothetical protein
MRKLSEKFARLSARTRFLVLFSILFIICVPAIPLVLHSDRRIYPEWSDKKFAAFGVFLCAAYAAFLAACEVFFSRFLKAK